MEINLKFIEKMNIGEALDEAIEESLMKIGEFASGAADDNAPIDTGLLHNSITYAIGGKAPAKKTYQADRTYNFGGYSGTHSGSSDEVYIGTNVRYAPYVEFGHGSLAESGMGGNPLLRGVPAKPFLRPALDNNTKAFERLAEVAFERVFNK